MLIRFRNSLKYLFFGSSYAITQRFSSQHSLKKTPLFDFHIANKANMVEYAGYHMPIHYSNQSIIESHRFVRTNCGLFDVSHMLQMKIGGNDRFDFMESLTCGDIAGLNPGSGTLSVYLSENGGILDDIIITNCKEPYLYIVSNAACASKIKAHVATKIDEATKMGSDLKMEIINNALIALQGPNVHTILRAGISPSDLKNYENLYFMESMLVDSLFGFKDDQYEMRLTRCGYTGEDGYEISVPVSIAHPLADKLIDQSSVKPIGLAARDTLRLEAGMCLYGNDISEETTPVEASLLWIIGKRRRQNKEPLFPGYSKIMQQITNKDQVKHRRVGFTSESGPAARHGANIFDPSTKKLIGQVTSGCKSPSMNHNIAMGYVQSQYIQNKTKIIIEIRKKFYTYEITKMPFVPHHYARRPSISVC